MSEERKFIIWNGAVAEVVIQRYTVSFEEIIATDINHSFRWNVLPEDLFNTSEEAEKWIGKDLFVRKKMLREGCGYE